MPLPTITNGYYCQLRMLLHSTQFAEITLCVVASGETSTTIGILVGDSFDDAIMPIMSQDLAHISTLVTKLDGVSAGVDSPSEAVGGDGNPAVPDQVACGITLQTGLAGRSKRGRWYLPGVSREKVDADPSLWKVAWVSDLTGALSTWVGAMDTGGAALQVLSRTHSSVQPVTDTVVRRQIRTQRRRLSGGF